MKFFIDTANLDQIREAHDLGVLDGVTTNPSLMAKEGIKGVENQRRHYVEICNIVQGDVSAEVIATDYEGMVREGKELAALNPHVSPFVGRLDDICEDGVGLVANIVRMYRFYNYPTQVLAASIRSSKHIMECVEAGADVATCPLSAIKGLMNHPLTDAGLKKFLEDYKKVNE